MEDLASIRRKRAPEQQREIAALNGGVARDDFEAAVLNLTAVEDLGCKSRRRSRDPLEQQVCRMAAVVRGFQRAAAIQETDVHATVPFLQTLRLDAGETRIRRQREPVHPSQLRSIQQGELLAEQRLISSLTV